MSSLFHLHQAIYSLIEASIAIRYTIRYIKNRQFIDHLLNARARENGLRYSLFRTISDIPLTRSTVLDGTPCVLARMIQCWSASRFRSETCTTSLLKARFIPRLDHRPIACCRRFCSRFYCSITRRKIPVNRFPSLLLRSAANPARIGTDASRVSGRNSCRLLDFALIGDLNFAHARFRRSISRSWFPSTSCIILRVRSR
jgi:hypothetical protein